MSNTITITGHLGQDAELKYTPSRVARKECTIDGCDARVHTYPTIAEAKVVADRKRVELFGAFAGRG